MSLAYCWTLKEGTFCCSAWSRSGSPTCWKAWAPTTCTGAALSAARTPVWRVPVTITSEIELVPEDAGAAVSCASAA